MLNSGGSELIFLTLLNSLKKKKKKTISFNSKSNFDFSQMRFKGSERKLSLGRCPCLVFSSYCKMLCSYVSLIV